MPELSTLVQASILEDMRHRVDVGPGALPSALMLTFLNSQQGLCCAAVSEDAALVAGAWSTHGHVSVHCVRRWLPGQQRAAV